MVQRYDVWCVEDIFKNSHDGSYVRYEDYAKLESQLNGILDTLTELDNDLGHGLIQDEYAYDRIGEILEKYRNVPGN